MAVGIAVPSPENSVGFFHVRLRIAQRDDCADGNAGRIGILKRSPACVMQHLFQLGFTPQKDALHLLGRFEFKILAEIAIRSGERDLPAVLGNFRFNQLFVFGLTLFQAAPGNDQGRGFLLRLRACDHAFQFWMNFNDPRQERPLR